MRWSQLQKQIEALFDESLDLRVRCTVQRGESGERIGRYWFVLNGETIWDEPRHVSQMLKAGEQNSDASAMGEIIREYLELPKDALMDYAPPLDRWGLADILRAADRRIGKRRLGDLKAKVQTPAALQIIAARLEGDHVVAGD